MKTEPDVRRSCCISAWRASARGVSCLEGLRVYHHHSPLPATARARWAGERGRQADRLRGPDMVRFHFVIPMRFRAGVTLVWEVHIEGELAAFPDDQPVGLVRSQPAAGDGVGVDHQSWALDPGRTHAGTGLYPPAISFAIFRKLIR